MITGVQDLEEDLAGDAAEGQEWVGGEVSAEVLGTRTGSMAVNDMTLGMIY
jgi:hypothetical protein